MENNFDFGGWATRTNIKCSDGRTILPNAFEKNDGTVVPLVWNHIHDDPSMVMGHALLTNHPEGVYAACSFNNSDMGKQGKELVEHGDIASLSIYANQLKQSPNKDVIHGNIREVSLVLAGANPGACINNVIRHGEDFDESEAEIFTGIGLDMDVEETMSHSDDKKEDPKMGNEKTVKDVFDSMTEEQKNVVYFLVGQAAEGAIDAEDDDEEDERMKHNAFDNYYEEDDDMDYLSHSEQGEILKAVAAGSGRSLREYMEDNEITHSEPTYGVNNIEYLFPDAKTIGTTPDFIKRDTGWVSKVMNGVHHTPFSRIKSIHANITEDDARALGYIKGKQKKEEVFPLLKRVTTPQTIYKKQKLDRDDIIDITDFDIVAWIRAEMRGMLDEEIARAILIGDGRSSISEDKIKEENVRPIWTDDKLYTIKHDIGTAQEAATEEEIANAFIEGCIRARKNYKGSGNPSLYTTEDVVTSCLLLKDKNGRFIYTSVDQLAATLRVKAIETVPVMENASREALGQHWGLLGIIVNLQDYNVGADKGGAVNMFDDFDIDYNQQKYLMETRISGALIKPYSAIALERKIAAPGA